MATSPTPLGITGTGSVEVTDASLILKVQRYRAVKQAEDALAKERKALAEALQADVLALGHEQFTVNGEPILTADEKTYTSIDKDYLARRAPVAFGKAQSKSYGLALSVNPTAKPR
jgi:hypothetical protein